MSNDYIYQLIQLLKVGSVSEQIKASEDLVKVGRDAIDPLIQALNDNSTLLQGWVLIILKKLDDKNTVNSILSFASNIRDIDAENIDLLSSALSAAVQILKTQVLDEQFRISDEQLAQIASLIHESNVDRDDEQNDISIEAVRALSNLKDDRVVKVLISALEDGDYPELRYAAAKALGKVGNRSALPSLVWTSQHDVNYLKGGGFDANVRDAASEAIKKIELELKEKI